MLNETNRDEVTRDLVSWLQKRSLCSDQPAAICRLIMSSIAASAKPSARRTRALRTYLRAAWAFAYRFPQRRPDY